jgi:hypothetical protein
MEYAPWSYLIQSEDHEFILPKLNTVLHRCPNHSATPIYVHQMVSVKLMKDWDVRLYSICWKNFRMYKI